jgi:pimeloyl-ACP methyl ester carboxylesterase
MKQKHIHWSDLHGYSRLAVEATLGITNLVEAMHHNILRLPKPLGKSATTPTGGVHGAVYTVLQKSSSVVYNAIRGATHLVRGGLDDALGHIGSELEHLNSSAQREAVLSILNGVLGDHMAQHHNPLTIPMGFRHQGRALELSPEVLRNTLPDAMDTKGKILILLHGHCMNDLQWTSEGHNHGEVLAQALGYTPIYLRYNTGLHISTNGRTLDGLLETLVQAWPVEVQDICIVGYSMGGLLARSALHYASHSGHHWPQKVRKLLFVGTPHHGSMVERAGNWVDETLQASPYSSALARLGKIRSAGTTDLRYGNLVDQDWAGRDRFAPGPDTRQRLPLPATVQCYAIAAMIAKAPSALHNKWVGDGLVPLHSALGQHRDAQRALGITPERQQVFYGTSHLRLLKHPQVCAQLQRWIAE